MDAGKSVFGLSLKASQLLLELLKAAVADLEKVEFGSVAVLDAPSSSTIRESQVDK